MLFVTLTGEYFLSLVSTKSIKLITLCLHILISVLLTLYCTLYVMRHFEGHMFEFCNVVGILVTEKEYQEVFIISLIFGTSSLTENILNASMKFWIKY